MFETSSQALIMQPTAVQACRVQLELGPSNVGIQCFPRARRPEDARHGEPRRLKGKNHGKRSEHRNQTPAPTDLDAQMHATNQTGVASTDLAPESLVFIGAGQAGDTSTHPIMPLITSSFNR